MHTARRLYVYLLSGISLGVLVAGLSMLLGLLLENLGLGPTGASLVDDGEAIRQRLTLATAMTAVALPLWLAHWTAAERGVRPGRPDAAEERTSDVRGLYFAAAMGILLIVTAGSLSNILRQWIYAAGSVESFGSGGIGGDLAMLLVAGAAWAYHVTLRSRDWARGPMTGGGAALPRTYLYLALLAGLWVFLTGFTGLIELAGRALLGDTGPALAFDPQAWWAYPLAEAVSGIVVGAAIWIGHAWYAGRLLRDDGWRGASERPARLRLAYFVGAIVSTAIATLYLAADGLRSALGAAFGVAEASGVELAGLILLPLLSSVAFGLAWYLHARRLEEEAETFAIPGRTATAGRLRCYAEVLVGLGFAAVSLAWLLGLLLDMVTGTQGVLLGGDSYRQELARYLPLLLIGAGVWLWRWRDAAARWTVDPAGEAGSTVRRAALLIVLAAAVLASVASLGYVLYRLFGALFGVTASGDVSSELSRAIGVLLVATAVALYHGVQLRRDQAVRAASAPDVTAESGRAVPSVLLRVTGPAGMEEATVVATVQQALHGADVSIVEEMRAT